MKAHERLEAEVADLIFERRTQRSIADQHEPDRSPACGDRCERTDEQIVSLDREEVGDAADDRLAVQCSNCSAAGRPFSVRHGRPDDHPIPDDPYLRRVDPVSVYGIRGGRSGVGDYDISEPIDNCRDQVFRSPKGILGIYVSTARHDDRGAGQGTQQSGTAEVGSSRRLLRVVAAPLRGERVGALALLQDLTEVRRAETVRRDFIANVSHELRTPLASLKAVVETLEEGAIEEPEVARDFLSKMHAEVDGMAWRELATVVRLDPNGLLERVGDLVQAAATAATEVAEQECASGTLTVAEQDFAVRLAHAVKARAGLCRTALVGRGPQRRWTG